MMLKMQQPKNNEKGTNQRRRKAETNNNKECAMHGRFFVAFHMFALLGSLWIQGIDANHKL